MKEMWDVPTASNKRCNKVRAGLFGKKSIDVDDRKGKEGRGGIKYGMREW